MKTRGQALVEMAIVIIVLFLLLFGIIQFGWLMYIKNTLNNAARAGVREAVVTSGLTVSSTTTITSSNYPNIYSTIFNSLHYVNTANVTATIVDVAGKSPSQSGDTIQVNVSLARVPRFVSTFFFSVPGTLLGQASMRYE